MQAIGFLFVLPSTHKDTHKNTRNYFINYDGGYNNKLFGFVSLAVKRAHINRRCGKKAFQDPEFNELRDKLEAIPVHKYGAKWQEYVDTFFEEQTASDARWQARCAIYAFNKMGTGIVIKFGTLGKGKGSMSRIKHVIIDNDPIPLRKFLDNAEFEQAILNSP